MSLWCWVVNIHRSGNSASGWFIMMNAPANLAQTVRHFGVNTASLLTKTCFSVTFSYFQAWKATRLLKTINTLKCTTCWKFNKLSVMSTSSTVHQNSTYELKEPTRLLNFHPCKYTVSFADSIPLHFYQASYTSIQRKYLEKKSASVPLWLHALSWD
jgi:hypothetical protein